MRHLILILAAISLAQNAQAHSGMTNSDGCHMNYMTNQFHCHQRKTPSFGQTTYCLHVNFKKYCGYAHSSCQNLQRQYGGMCLVDW